MVIHVVVARCQGGQARAAVVHIPHQGVHMTEHRRKGEAEVVVSDTAAATAEGRSSAEGSSPLEEGMSRPEVAEGGWTSIPEVRRKEDMMKQESNAAAGTMEEGAA